ncbi:MAG: GNAT family N-acetyltransferase [Catenulispora sp.]|nr:GNAT family N-acetyltransferase [Catenulispora sp.]
MSRVDYSELADQEERSRQVRYCRLKTEAGDQVAELEVHSFQMRFGAVAVAAEGIGGVETQPEFRRQGHMSRLLRQALSGMAERVDVAFVSDGIEGVYEKFGFVPAVADGHLTVSVRSVERAVGADMDKAVPGIRSGSAADLPMIVRLYNSAHAQRPGTHERHEGWNRLIPQSTWRPGSQSLILEADGAAVGYAVLEGRSFGDPLGSVTVDELVAVNAATVRLLLVAVARLCWQRRLSEFIVREPTDSLVGRVARQMGCSYQQRFPSSGGMMAAVLNRSALVNRLEPELRRRAASHVLDERFVKSGFGALQCGELIPDGRALVRLLLGYWSTDDAQTHGVSILERYVSLCSAWFPGGGTPFLPTPYSHRLDRY